MLLDRSTLFSVKLFINVIVMLTLDMDYSLPTMYFPSYGLGSLIFVLLIQCLVLIKGSVRLVGYTVMGR